MKKATAELDTPLDERPELQELKAKCAAAQAELMCAEAELDALDRTLNPIPDSSDSRQSPNELQTIQAQRELPLARERYLMAKAEILELKPRVEVARIEALRHFTAVRTKARLPFLKRFSTALDEAARIGEELAAFDQETVRLGGSNPGHPFAQLINEPPYRFGEATRVRDFVREMETANG